MGVFTSNIHKDLTGGLSNAIIRVLNLGEAEDYIDIVHNPDYSIDPERI